MPHEREEVARLARDWFDRPDVQILASGDLNEDKIRTLLDAGAPVDTFGVGTEMGVSYDAPALGGVYKLVEDVRGYRIKRSAGKVTLPGRKQIWRAVRDGRMLEDIIALRNEPAPAGARPLLDDVLRGGRRTWNESLQEARQRCRDRLASLPPVLKELNGDVYPVRLSDGLQVLRRQMAAEREDP